ncbi:MAG: hypothetical protein AAFY53_10740 [Pseudomonadota bacterium]
MSEALLRSQPGNDVCGGNGAEWNPFEYVMKTIGAHIRPAPDGYEPGCVTVALSGLRHLPRTATIRVRLSEQPQIGKTAPPSRTQGPDGERGESFTPIGRRQSADGTELIMAPVFARQPLLRPGAAVVLEIEEAGVSAEVLWPRIGATVDDRPEDVLTPLPKSRAAARFAQSPDYRRGPDRSPGRQVADGTDSMAPAGRSHRAVSQQPAPVSPPREPEAVVQRYPAASSVDPSSRWPTEPSSPLIEALLSEDENNQAVEFETSEPVPLEETGDPRPLLMTRPFADAVKPRAIAPVVVHAPADASLGEGGRTLPAVAPKLSSQKSRSVQPNWPARAAMLVMVLVAVGGAGLAFLSGGSARTAPLPAHVLALLPPGDTAQTARQKAELARVMAVPVRAPNGDDGQSVHGAEAARRAEVHLARAGSDDDLAIAKFWLRHAIRKGLVPERLTWAAAQLAALYARPVGGVARAETARALFELAARRGHAASMCALGRIYQQGLSVDRDMERAVGFYAAAVRTGRLGSGGCHEAARRLFPPARS